MSTAGAAPRSVAPAGPAYPVNCGIGTPHPDLEKALLTSLGTAFLEGLRRGPRRLEGVGLLERVGLLEGVGLLERVGLPEGVGLLDGVGLPEGVVLQGQLGGQRGIPALLRLAFELDAVELGVLAAPGQ